MQLRIGQEYIFIDSKVRLVTLELFVLKFAKKYSVNKISFHRNFLTIYMSCNFFVYFVHSHNQPLFIFMGRIICLRCSMVLQNHCLSYFVYGNSTFEYYNLAGIFKDGSKYSFW